MQVPDISLIAFMTHIPDKVSPGYAIGSSYKPGVSYRAEGLSNVRGVGNIAMGTEKDGPQSRSISCVTEVRIGRRIGT